MDDIDDGEGDGAVFFLLLCWLLFARAFFGGCNIRFRVFCNYFLHHHRNRYRCSSSNSTVWWEMKKSFAWLLPSDPESSFSLRSRGSLSVLRKPNDDIGPIESTLWVFAVDEGTVWWVWRISFWNLCGFVHQANFSSDFVMSISRSQDHNGKPYNKEWKL